LAPKGYHHCHGYDDDLPLQVESSARLRTQVLTSELSQRSLVVHVSNRIAHAKHGVHAMKWFTVRPKRRTSWRADFK
jgi:hypothetical protein